MPYLLQKPSANKLRTSIKNKNNSILRVYRTVFSLENYVRQNSFQIELRSCQNRYCASFLRTFLGKRLKKESPETPVARNL